MKKRRSFLRRGSKVKTGDDHDDQGVDPSVIAQLQRDQQEEEQQEEDHEQEDAPVATETESTSATVGPQTHIERVNARPQDGIHMDTARSQLPDLDSATPATATVNQACEAIWTCQEPIKAAKWLELLHHSLLTATLDSYVPSEVFLCISGAVLRFQQREQQDDNGDHAAWTENDLWKLWDESMWAAAALARVCVGVAWRHQLRKRRAWMTNARHHHHGLETAGNVISPSASNSKDVSSDSSSPLSTRATRPVSVASTKAESHSPTTSNSVPSRSSLKSRDEKHYPAIPEQTPAAMLRFATMDTFRPQMMDHAKRSNAERQVWLDRVKSLAEAQRELVLALCYILPGEEPEDPTRIASSIEWTILEAHEPVACLVRSWLESATISFNFQTMPASQISGVDEKHAETREEALATETSSVLSKHSMEVMSNATAVTPTGTYNNALLPRTEQDESIEHPRTLLYNRLSNGNWGSVEIDWWTTFQVVRAVLQLLSAGWCMPQDENGEEIVGYLLAIAEKGMTLPANELRSYGTEIDRVAREERLAASSSAVTAVSILSSLASVGRISPCVQPITLKALCRMHAEVMESDSHLGSITFPSEASLLPKAQEEWKSDYETFLEHRDDYISDIVALYWVFLAHSTSAAASMSIWLEMMLLNDSIDERRKRGDDVGYELSKGTSGRNRTGLSSRRAQIVQFACIAVDAVSGGLWGRPPDTPGLANLRICWYSVLQAFRTISVKLHDWIVEIDDAWDEMQQDSSTVHTKFVHDALMLLFRVIVSFKRFIRQELLLGEGLLAPDEWEALVSLLDENIAKWLCMTDETSSFATQTTMINDIRFEVGLLLDEIRKFFCHCIEFQTSPFNLVVDDECRTKLYSLLLQKAVPYMPTKQGTMLSLAVLRCWSITGFAIHRSDSWGRTASYIITDVFSVFEDQGFGPYGGYVHSPRVRLEALKLIALEEEQDGRGVLDTESEQEAFQHISPLEQSTHLREQYLALVNGSLLPPLMNMFSVQSSNIHVAVVLPLPTPSFSGRKQEVIETIYGPSRLAQIGDEKRSTMADDHALRRFATKLLGRLYRSGSGEKWHRSSLLKMMLSAAINNSSYESKVSSEPKRNSAPALEEDSEVCLTGESHTALQAIHELEKCLCLPFGSLPSAHESLPPVVDALCSVLIVYGGEPLKERTENDECWLAMKRYLAVAAVLPLVRLGIDHDNRLLLKSQRNISDLVPAHIASQLVLEFEQAKNCPGLVKYDGHQVPEVTPFITVSIDPLQRELQSASGNSRSKKERTQLSFISAFSSLLATLHTNLESKRIRDRIASATNVGEGIDCRGVDIVDSRFRALCFDAICGFVRAGLKFPFTTELITILQDEADNILEVEISAKCRCAGAVAESIAARFEIAPETTSIEGVAPLLQHVLRSCSSPARSSVIIGCESLRGLVNFASERIASCDPLVYSALLDRLRVEIRTWRESAVLEPDRVEPQDVMDSLLSILYDYICASAKQDCDFPSSDMLWRTFDMCLDLSKHYASIPPTCSCRLFCSQLVAVVLNKRCIDDMEFSRGAINDRFNDWTPSVSSMLELPMEGSVEEDGRGNFFMVLDDLMTQKLLSFHCQFDVAKSLDMTYHEFMAKETDDINRFVAEDLGSDKEAPFAAWLCGRNCLLTFRLGSWTSRYRGWLEIVLRFPSSRRRKLVRLPSLVSLDCPELPSSLWKGTSRRTDGQVKAADGASTESASGFTGPSIEMKRARSVMQRFDEMFDQHTKSTRPESDRSSSSVREQGAMNNASNNGARSVLVETLSDENEDAGSIEEWLRLVLQDPAKEQLVVDELCALHVLQSTDTTTKSSDSDFNGHFRPVERLSFNPKLRRALSIIDRIPPFDTHKIALLYASDTSSCGNSNDLPPLEDLLLAPTSGSTRFLSFSESLGRIVLTRHLKYFSGGLDSSGLNSDGKLSVVWLDRDDCFVRSMIVFHVAHMMPSGTKNRKSHIGNDNVLVVFVDPGSVIDRNLRQGQANETVTSKVMSGHFGFVIVFVQILTNDGLYKVSVCLRDGLTDDMHSRLSHLVGEHIVSAAAAPCLVRRVASRADTLCCSSTMDQLGRPSNWEERRAQIAATKRHRIVKRSI